MPYRVMIVEDEEKIREMVSLYLKQAGYMVSSYANGIDALSDMSEFKPHIAVLDITMPGISGLDVLTEIRAVSKIPVIMLTAMTAEVDRLKGFEMGADDYVCKPFSPKEVVSRVNVFIKRLYKSSGEILQYRELKLDTVKKALFKSDTRIDITTREYELLYVFFNNIARPLTREQIIGKAIGYDYEGYDRSIDAFIKNIRQKIEDDLKKPVYIKTKYGYGYVFGGDDDEH
jgi:DNA-binding response OmpR family regulator